jgi:hypothetical protein
MPTALGTIASHRTAPAPTGPPVTTGMVGWWDASTLALADGATVTSWPDNSGAGRHMTPVAAGPILKTAVQNGKSVVRFDGTDRILQAAGSIVVPQHVFAVAKYAAATMPSYNGLFTGSGASDQDILFIGSGGTKWYAAGGTYTYHKDGVLDATLTAPMNAFAVMSMSNPTLWYGYLQFQIGNDRGNAGRYWNGDVAELIVYDRVLSTVERQQVEAYLTAKWIPAGTDVLLEPFNNFTFAPWTTGGTIVAGRTGTAAQLTGSNTATYTLPTGNRSYYATIGFAYKVSSVGTSPRKIFSFRDSTASYFTTLQIETNGALGFYGGDSAQPYGTSSAGLIVAATWYYLEVQVFIANTGGSFTVRCNGSIVISGTAMDTQQPGSPASPIAEVMLRNISGQTAQFDDLYLTMGAGAPFKGDITIP